MLFRTFVSVGLLFSICSLTSLSANAQSGYDQEGTCENFEMIGTPNSIEYSWTSGQKEYCQWKRNLNQNTQQELQQIEQRYKEKIQSLRNIHDRRLEAVNKCLEQRLQKEKPITVQSCQTKKQLDPFLK